MLRILVPALLVLCIRRCRGIRCKSCESGLCTGDPEDCQHGLVKDYCQCCNICAQTQGENCGGNFGTLGTCGEGLICSKLPPEKDRVYRLWHNLGICKLENTH